MAKREVQASVKDDRLVERRRTQMIKGAVQLFKEKGFHGTTTREIAKAAGFSIGTLYEYIRTKEDVLYLVCDYIYEEFQGNLKTVIGQNDGTLEGLKLSIRFFYQLMDRMQDEVLVMYQEVKALTKDTLTYVLKKEIEIVGVFEEVIRTYIDANKFELIEPEMKLLAHNIVVQGQMWSFRRWSLSRTFTLDEYIELQTDLLLRGLPK